MALLAFVFEHAIEGRLGGDVLPLVGETGHDLARGQVAHLLAVGDIEEFGALSGAELVGGRGLGSAAAVSAPFRALVAPPLQRPRWQPEDLTGFALTRSGADGLVDEGEDHRPLLPVVSSSSSPQSARAFFASTRSAAVSASALSLRSNSRSSSRSRFCSRVRSRRPPRAASVCARHASTVAP